MANKEKPFEIDFEITVEGRVVIHAADDDAAVAILKKMRLSEIQDALSTPDFYIDAVYEVEGDEESEESEEAEETEGEADDE